MEYLHSDGELNQNLLILGSNLYKLVEFFENSNIYEFIQKLLPDDLISFLNNKDIALDEIFNRQRISYIISKIPTKSKTIFVNIIWTIDNLISDLSFVLSESSAY